MDVEVQKNVDSEVRAIASIGYRHDNRRRGDRGTLEYAVTIGATKGTVMVYTCMYHDI